jgi:hypothetical protein
MAEDGEDLPSLWRQYQGDKVISDYLTSCPPVKSMIAKGSWGSGGIDLGPF